MASFECSLRGHYQENMTKCGTSESNSRRRRKMEQGAVFPRKKRVLGEMEKKGTVAWPWHWYGQAGRAAPTPPWYHVNELWDASEASSRVEQSYFYPQYWGWSLRVSQGAGMSVGSINSILHLHPSVPILGTPRSVGKAKWASDICSNICTRATTERQTRWPLAPAWAPPFSKIQPPYSTQADRPAWPKATLFT